MQHDVANTTFFRCTSDSFFENNLQADILPHSYDLGYIDGMHLFEYALRDLINLEKWSRTGSVIIVDDVIPRDTQEASRKPSGGSWAGDVWKIVPCLKQYRPDLYESMILAKSEPTGCLIITTPDNASTSLSQNYEEIISKFLDEAYGNFPDNDFFLKSCSAEEAISKLRLHLEKP